MWSVVMVFVWIFFDLLYCYNMRHEIFLRTFFLTFFGYPSATSTPPRAGSPVTPFSITTGVCDMYALVAFSICYRWPQKNALQPLRDAHICQHFFQNTFPRKPRRSFVSETLMCWWNSYNGMQSLCIHVPTLVWGCGCPTTLSQKNYPPTTSSPCPA